MYITRTTLRRPEHGARGTPDELFGWAVLLDQKRPGPPGAKVRGPSKKRHNEVAHRIFYITTNVHVQADRLVYCHTITACFGNTLLIL